MKTSDFDYNLPEELIAQTPLKDRASSRLLILDRNSKSFLDKHFTDIIDYLRPGDALVLNETKVIPARIIGKKSETGGAIELLLLKDLGNDEWECLARPQKRLKPGTEVVFCDNLENPLLFATITEVLGEGITHVRFTYSGIFMEILEKIGRMPLPPYIHEELKNQNRYQTVYAHNLGSAAAPTAGLHFTPELLQKITEKGIKIIKVTLHVGLGTFRPVQVDDVKNHKMHIESYEITDQAAKEINAVKAAGGKIFAVGTTSVRTLETVATKFKGKIQADSGDTDIFIYPGYKFKIVDGLITNFHLPKSTLLMLVSAFAGQTQLQPATDSEAADFSGRDLVLKAYNHAVKENYRFFSFGDAMLII